MVWRVLGAQPTVPSQEPSQDCLQRKMEQGLGSGTKQRATCSPFPPPPPGRPAVVLVTRVALWFPRPPSPSTLQALSTLQKTRWNQAEPLFSAKTLPFMPGPDRPDNGGVTTTLIMRPQGLEDNWRRGRDRARLAAGVLILQTRRARAELAIGLGHPVGCWLEETGGDKRSRGGCGGEQDRRQHAQKSEGSSIQKEAEDF